jgi:hypothetical protein
VDLPPSFRTQERQTIMEHREDHTEPLTPSVSTPLSTLLSRRTFLTRSGYSVAALLALSLWDGTGAPPALARTGGSGGPVRLGGGRLLGATRNTRFQLPLWGDAAHWDDPIYYTTMQASRRYSAKTYQFSDVDGDGREEMFIRGPGGLEVVKWNAPNAQWMPLPGDHSALVGGFADIAYGIPGYEYISTIQTADIDGDGAHEVIGRIADGLELFKYDATGQIWRRLGDFPFLYGDADGFGSSPAYYQTIQCAPIVGAPPKGSSTPPKYQTIGRGPDGLVAVDLGAWNEHPTYSHFSDTLGWNLFPSYWSTIQYADVDGDGNWEVVAHWGTGLEIHKLLADGKTWAQLATYAGWSDSVWNQPAQYSTIQCADIDGDGVAEILGNGINGLETLKYDPASKTIGPYNPASPYLGDTAQQYGWNQPQQYATIQFADIDGDGAMEMIARAGSPGIMAFQFDTSTNTWVRLPEGDVNNELSDANGFDEVQYYATFQSARVLLPGDQDYTGDGTHSQAIVFARGSSCVLTYRWDVPSQSWAPCRRLPPAFTGGQANAYSALATALNLTGANGNVRSLYNDLALHFDQLANRIYTVQPPSFESLPSPPSLPIPAGATGFTAEDWQAVCWQIYWEMQWVSNTQGWFDNAGKLIHDTFLGETFNLQSVGNYLNLSSTSGTQVVLNIFSVIGNAAWAVLGLPSLGAGTASAVAGMIGVAFGAAAAFLPSDGTYATAYSGLQDQLASGFNAAIAANEDNLNQIVGGTNPVSGKYVLADYGLLKMFGENIMSGVWKWLESGALTTTAQRGYALGCWQALISATTMIDKRFSSDEPPGGGPYFPPPQYWYHYANGKLGFIVSNDLNNDKFADSTYSALFDPVDPTDLYPFPLGVPQYEVVDTFTHGWPQLGYVDGISAVPSRPLARHPDIRVIPALTRDAKTGEVVVTITIANRGIQNATNAHLTSVKLGNRSNVPNTTKTHHFLRSNFTETMEVRFPSLAAGTKTVLAIRGQYKGGTFGGSVRVAIP